MESYGAIQKNEEDLYSLTVRESSPRSLEERCTQVHRDNSEKTHRKLVWLAVSVKGNWTAGEQSVKDTFY